MEGSLRRPRGDAIESRFCDLQPLMLLLNGTQSPGKNYANDTHLAGLATVLLCERGK